MPERLTIGTRKAFEKIYPFPYVEKQIGSETVYVASKGSPWARPSEFLVLRCVMEQDGSSGTWTAWDSAVSANGLTLQCRQPVFRCLATDITQPGWHNWQTKHVASPDDAGLAVYWQGVLWAETRVPCCNDASCVETTQVVDTQHQLRADSSLTCICIHMTSVVYTQNEHS